MQYRNKKGQFARDPKETWGPWVFAAIVGTLIMCMSWPY